jgi:hypothetical protein
MQPIQSVSAPRRVQGLVRPSPSTRCAIFCCPGRPDRPILTPQPPGIRGMSVKCVGASGIAFCEKFGRRNIVIQEELAARTAPDQRVRRKYRTRSRSFPASIAQRTCNLWRHRQLPSLNGTDGILILSCRAVDRLTSSSISRSLAHSSPSRQYRKPDWPVRRVSLKRSAELNKLSLPLVTLSVSIVIS